MPGKYASPFDGKARVIGLVSTLCVHAGLFYGMTTVGLTPATPPEESPEILIDFTEDAPEPKTGPIEVKSGTEPRARQVSEDINLVQKAEAQEQGLRENRGEESVMGDEGDVEKPEPPRKKEIDRRALFSSSRNRQSDTLQAQVAEDPQNSRLKEGHASGNTSHGRTDGTPTARLEGRTVVGALPAPEYAAINESGTVVVTIKVDAYGRVIDAKPGTSGTTVMNANLWAASRKAALQAKFSNGTSAVQEGTITYVFNLK